MSRKFDGSSEVEGLSSYDTVSDKHGRRNGSLTSGALALPTDGDSVEERSDCSDYTTINDRRVLADQINEYTLDKLEKMKDSASSSLDQIVRKERFSMGRLEDEMRTILQHIQTPAHDWETVTNYLQETFPDHLDSFMSPPFWIDKLAEDLHQDIKAEGQWTTVLNPKKKCRNVDIPNTIYSFWKTGQDILFLQPPQPPQPQPPQQQSQPS